MALQIPVASLVNTVDSRYYAPTYTNASITLDRYYPPAAKLVASRQWNWVPNNGNPASGYPISGTSQIILSQCYQDPAVATAIHDLLNSHYTSNSFASIIHGNGFDTVPSNYQIAITNDFLSNAKGFNLDIDNAAVCSGMVIGR
ncbi:phosphate ABC transporter substrate-binding protein [Burkholderia cenocepacia]|uniref:Phosphate ABC transporter substrate-binding protein n=1 Tax=Burkholderia cenocepacia TaxID=95486 RepID=A0A6J5JY16_9BURK|nr:phosphate ABC transporter substrate-binding protein [Burkholderia cenocepacia]